jgi:hypothetical protein
MKTIRCVTLVVGLLVVGASIALEVKDGGNIDYYRRPLSYAWIVSTVLLAAQKHVGVRGYLSRAWWIQILAPFIIFIASFLLVAFHEPYPIK